MANSGVKAIGVALMRTVLAKYPNLKLSLTESLSGATLMHLMASEVDLALVYNPPSEKELFAEPVLEEEMFCVGTPKLVGKGKTPIAFEELTRLPLILLRYGLGLSSRALLDDPVLLKRLEGQRHPASQLDHRHDRRAGGGTGLRHRDKTVRAGTAGGGPPGRPRSDRAEADPDALSVPAAQPADDLCDGRDAPADAGLDRRQVRQRRLAGDAGGSRAASISRFESRTLPSICSSGFLAGGRQHAPDPDALRQESRRTSAARSVPSRGGNHERRRHRHGHRTRHRIRGPDDISRRLEACRRPPMSGASSSCCRSAAASRSTICSSPATSRRA